MALNSGITNLISEVKECVDEIFKMLEGPGIKANKNFTNFLDALNNSANPFLIKDLDKKSKKIADQSFVNKNSASVNDIAICDCLTQILDNNTVYASYKKILDLTYQLGLLGDINASMQDFTNENNTILLSGTNDIVKRIIDGCETPFIYERIGMYLHNFLLDEFQDTSRMQWENLLPLVRNGLANGHDSLIIGDVKQSIYRFRNSDPQLLHSQLKVDFSNDSIKYNEGRSINWRSARNIVHWNNAFSNSCRWLSTWMSSTPTWSRKCRLKTRSCPDMSLWQGGRFPTRKRTPTAAMTVKLKTTITATTMI